MFWKEPRRPRRQALVPKTPLAFLEIRADTQMVNLTPKCAAVTEFISYAAYLISLLD